MKKSLIAAATLAATLCISSAAFAQNNSSRSDFDKDVNPHTPGQSGEQSKFGMNNGGDPSTKGGLHGGDTSASYKSFVDKKGLTQGNGGQGAGKK